ncbi:MAG: TonB-dependent receptor [Bryobacteraceae bacterium]|nr:TonB-dependent receptor [Bryobacteraceae bacterium]
MRKRLLSLLFVLACASVTFAQQAGVASISGVVRDASGSTVPSAKVVVSNESKGINRNLETNQDGIFLAPSLTPAAGYAVKVEAAGFAVYERKEMTLNVGQSVSLDIALNVAGSTQTVEVTSGAPLVETTKTGVSQVVNSAQIDNLPINGRRVDSFVLLTPGVTSDGAFGLVSFRGAAGGNTFLTDGNDTTNQYYNENAGRTRITTQISQDAVQEFQVLSNGYSAEYGRAIGGVVNTVTRSGTNDTHGTAYWFFRNRTLNARDRYANFNPPEWRHQAGGSLGGAIKKDKLFYFFNYEVTRRNFPLLNRLINTGFTDSVGNFNAACPAQISQTQCFTARDYVMRNNGVLLPRKAETNVLFGKLDYQLNSRNSISASMNYMDWESPNGIQTQAVLTNNNGAGNNADSTVRTRYGRLAWTAIPSSTIVNEARFGWFKDRLYDPNNPALIPAQTGKLGISVNSAAVGAATDYDRLNPSEQRFQFADNVSWNVGKHALKIGGEIISTQDYTKLLRQEFGSYSYASFATFALDFSGVRNPANGFGNYNSFLQRFGNRIVDTTMKDYMFYVQDQYRATSKLTLNLGVRYEYTVIPQPKLTNPDYPATAAIASPGKNFAPRFSMSYSLTPKTVVRGGFGMFYSRFQSGLIQNLHQTNGLYQQTISVQPPQAGAPIFPNVVGSATGFPAGSIDLQVASKDFRNPYTLQGDLAIEREIMPNLGLSVSYVYSRGVQLFTTRDLNLGAQGPNVTFRVNDSSGTQVNSFTTPTYLNANRVDRRYNRVWQVENGGQSWYNGLIVQLNKRFSHGIQAGVAYTWSHAIDLGGIGAGNDALFYTGLRTFQNGVSSIDRGSSALDQRHRFVVNSLWSPKFTRSTSAVAKYLINGWQLSQITTVASPIFANATVNVSGAAFAGAAFTGSLNGAGGTTRVPFYPTNFLEVDNIVRVDARLSRELPFTERVKLWMNFEAFNVFNHVSNTGVNTQAFSTANGVLTPTANVGLGNASQGFPDGTNARRAQVSLRLVF